MKTITIAGNITKDALTRRTQSGEPVTGFSVAVNDHRTKQALFFDVTIWGKRGDAIVGYLTKGTKVAISGDLGTREHDGRTYLTVNANEVTLMGGGDKQPSQDSQQQRMTSRNGDVRKPAHGAYANDLDDEIPFIMEWR